MRTNDTARLLFRQRGANELQTERVHAVARLFAGKSFAVKHVPEVAFAVCANNFGAHPVGIGELLYVLANHVVEAGPARAGVELVFGAEQREVATPAKVRACFFAVVVLARIGALRALLLDDVRLFFRKCVVRTCGVDNRRKRGKWAVLACRRGCLPTGLQTP